MTNESSYISAQARLHHAYLLGLQLMVASNRSAAEVGDWMFSLFRRQHLEKFLAGFEKLGLTDLPPRRCLCPLSCAVEQHGRCGGGLHGRR